MCRRMLGLYVGCVMSGVAETAENWPEKVKRGVGGAGATGSEVGVVVEAGGEAFCRRARETRSLRNAYSSVLKWTERE